MKYTSVLKNGGLFLAVLATSVVSTDTIPGFVHRVNTPAPPEPGPTIELDPPRDAGGDKSGAPLPDIAPPAPAASADDEDFVDGRSLIPNLEDAYRTIRVEQDHGGGIVIDYIHINAVRYSEQYRALVIEHDSADIVVQGAHLKLACRKLRRHELGRLIADPPEPDGTHTEPGDLEQPYIASVKVIQPGSAFHFGKQGEFVSDDL
jgi:hypothetical protein